MGEIYKQFKVANMDGKDIPSSLGNNLIEPNNAYLSLVEGLQE